MAENKPDKPNNPNQNRDTLRYRKSEKSIQKLESKGIVQ